MRGHTLVELLFVLTLMGATTASLAPTARRYRDRASVVAAREAMVGLLAEARSAAMEVGDAALVIDAAVDLASSTTPDSTLRTISFATDFEVGLELSGGRSDVDLEFDALGLGRMTGQTIRFVRGGAASELVVSAYGRVRRR